MHTCLQTPLVRLLCLLTVVGCAAHPSPEVAPPSRGVSEAFNAYITDLRSLMADMEQVQDDWKMFPDARALHEHPVFHDTMRRLDAYIVEAMQARNMQVYRDKVRAFDATIKAQGNVKLHQFMQAIIGYHARLVQLTATTTVLSKKIEAMEPRGHDLMQQLRLAAAQQASGEPYTAMMAILHHEQDRFARNVQAWIEQIPQTQ